MKKKLFLVDTSSLFFRAFYAVRPLHAPSGLPTNAIFGFMSMLLKLLKDEKPDYCVFCYDRKDPSFRKEVYEGYKANRTEMPEDLGPQIPYIQKIATLLGIPGIEVPSYEADDVIGALTKIGHKKGLEVNIVSGDKDFAQLIEDDIYIFDTMKNSRLDTKGVVEKYGITAAQFVDYLAIVGDSSDNIPGVKGLGPKGAAKLLQEYQTLENVYANIENIKGSTKEKLEANKEMAFLSKKLVTIVTDLPISQNLEDYAYRGINWPELRQFFEELNFKNFEKTVLSLTCLVPGAVSSAAMDTTAVTATSSTQQELFTESSTSSENYPDLFFSDVESKLGRAKSILIFTTAQGVFVKGEDELFKYLDDVRKLAQWAFDKNISWEGYSLKEFFRQYEISQVHTNFDLMLAAYIVKPGESMTFDRITSRFTGETLSELPTASEWLEAYTKAKVQSLKQIEEIHASDILQKMDMPVIPVLLKMETLGVKLDLQALKKQSDELAKEIKDLEKSIHEHAGQEFNIASPKQLAPILFDKLKLPPGKKTKTGFSTDSDVLEKLKKQHPIVELILSYRELTKLKSTYVDSLPSLVKEDGRIHTHFNQALTTTGRLSSHDPNLQNIPIRTDRGARVRRAFVAENGKCLLSADYSQIELRVLAHFSDDSGLKKAFSENIDVHSATASEVFSVKLADVTADMRRTSKAINFGIAYGQGAFGLAEVLGISRSEAQDIIKKYFTKFSRVRDYIESTIQSAREKGYVETYYGRRRYIDELKSSSVAIQKFGERAAINAPIQGTASDIVKKAMIDLFDKIEVPMILQVHDELIFEAEKSVLENNAKSIIQIMENVAKLSVPLKVNYSIGQNWDEAH